MAGIRGGRRSKPTAVKKAAGNPGRRALNRNEPQPDDSTLPLPPDGLPASARRVWETYAPLVHKIGALTDLDRPQFAKACVMEAVFEVALADLTDGASKDPDIDPARLTYTSEKGSEGKSAMMQILFEATKQARIQWHLFGGNPSARSQMVMPPQEDPDAEARNVVKARKRQAMKPLSLRLVEGGQA